MQPFLQNGTLLTFRFACNTWELFSAPCDLSSLVSVVDLLEAVSIDFSPLFDLYVNPLVNQIKRKAD